MYKGIRDVFFSCITNEGWIGLYRGMVSLYLSDDVSGLPPALLGIIPYAAIDLATYDILKTLYITVTNSEPNVITLLCCGACSGTAGQFSNSVLLPH